MKDYKICIIVRSTLLIIVFMFLSFIPIISLSQSRSTPLNLIGTEWQTEPYSFSYTSPDGYVSGFQYLQYSFIFEKRSKVTLTILTTYLLNPTKIASVGTALQTGNSTEPTSFYYSTPKLESSVGTFNSNDNSVQIEFANFKGVAVLKGNSLEFEGTSKTTDSKAKWLFKRVSETEENKIDTKNNIKNRQKADELFAKAYNLAEQKKYNEAIELYTKAVQFDPSHIYSFTFRGTSKLYLLDYQGALADYNIALELCNKAESEYKKSKKTATSSKGSDPILQFEPKSAEQKALEAIWHQYTTSRVNLLFIYYYRGIVNEKLGNKSFSCEDYRKSCASGNKQACEKVKQVCQ